MQSYGTILGQNSNAAFNDPDRAAKMREDKFKRKLAEIEAKGAMDIKQQEVANTGAKDVQEIRNTGELSNTQLTGDIQQGLRESMIQENMAKAGLAGSQSKEAEALGGLYGAKALEAGIDAEIKGRSGQRMADLQTSGQEVVNKSNEEKVALIQQERQAQQQKLEGAINPKDITATQALDLYNIRKEEEDQKSGKVTGEVNPDAGISISRSLVTGAKYLNSIGGGIGTAVGTDLGAQLKNWIKKKKITW